uniref:Response regulator receiver protein n=1 Tax=mine drainage metagenome TaxID=410659 RepID=E6QL18_9ZZZZ
MRPKKIILCVDNNERTLSVRKFLLETRGFRVLTASTARDAIAAFTGQTIDLALVELKLPQMDGNALVGHLKEISSEVPMILVSDSVRAGEQAHQADAFLGKGNCSPAEIIERIRVMSARKRGPRKAAQPAFAQNALQLMIPGIPTAQAS